MCYARLVQLMQVPSFAKSIYKVSYTKPDIVSQGMAGYIETEVTIELQGCADLLKLAQVLSSELNHDEYMKIYNRLVS